MEITPLLREELKKPLGELVADAESVPRGRLLVSVGDTASDTLLSSGREPKMIVYDGRARRREIGVSGNIRSYDADEYSVANPPGTLNEDAFTVFKAVFAAERPGKVFVEGEEDLTALAAIVEAPDGALVVYGQPDEGLVVVEVGEEIRDQVEHMLEEMRDGR